MAREYIKPITPEEILQAQESEGDQVNVLIQSVSDHLRDNFYEKGNVTIELNVTRPRAQIIHFVAKMFRDAGWGVKVETDEYKLTFWQAKAVKVQEGAVEES